MTFQIGDTVTHKNADGWYADVVGFKPNYVLVVLCKQQGEGEWDWNGLLCSKATFPIPADEDPWAKTEPDARPLPMHQMCQLESDAWACTRLRGHAGHHISRHSKGDVADRWPQAAPAEKRGPRYGDEIVVAKQIRDSWTLLVGDRGTVISVGPSSFGAVFGMATRCIAISRFGTDVILASDWDAGQKRDTERCPPPDASQVQPEQPEGNAAFLHDLVNEITPQRLARALFELDFDEHAIRVGDDGKGGIGKAAVLERMWSRVSDETRGEYEMRAAIALKRAGELP
jgi:hypothetical protein